jgi:hypothetical protein
MENNEPVRRLISLTEIIHWACCPCEMEGDWTHTETDSLFQKLALVERQLPDISGLVCPVWGS